MRSVTIDICKTLVAIQSVTRATIECFDGRRWVSVLRGREEFVLKSAKQNPKSYAKLESALLEVQGLGLCHAEIDFTKWQREQATL